MKRFIGLAVVFAMLFTLFSGISITTNAATTSVTETITLINQTYEDDCTSADMKTPMYGNGEIKTENENKVMNITPGTAVSTVLSSATTEIPTDKYTLTFDMRAVSPNAGFTIVVKNPYHEENSGFENGYSLLITPGTFVSTGTDGNLSVVDDAWYTYTVDVDVDALNGAEITASQASGKAFLTLSRKNRDTGTADSKFSFNGGSSSNSGVRFGLVTNYAPSDTPDGISFVTVKGNTRWGSDQASLGVISADTYYPSTNYQVDNVTLTYEYTDTNTYVVAQNFDDDKTDFLTPFYNSVQVATEAGTSNKFLDLKDYANSGVIGTTSLATNIPSNQYTIRFDMRAVSPNAGINLVVNNPYHASLPGFDHGAGLTGYALTITPGTFVSADEGGYLNNVDDEWYTYTVTVDVDKLEGAALANGRACGSKFITLSRKNRDTGVADTSFGFNADSSSNYGVRFNLADSGNTSSSTPSGVTFFTRKAMTRWTKDLTAFSTSVGDSFADINYQLDNVKVFYEEAEEEEVTSTSITNIVMQLGSNLNERNFTWFSTSSETGYITYATADELVDGKLPADAAKVAATRDGDGVSLKAGYYNNKTTITDLVPGATYYYQLSNGTDVTDMYSFKVGEESSSFSFAYIGDSQMAAGSLGVPQNALDWQRTINQLTTDPAFEGIAFMASAGDQISTNTSSPNYIDNEIQYDGYLNHPQFTSLAQTSLLGNHDNWSRGSHYQHFNEPNYMIDEETGEYYGVTKYNSYILSADYWYTYNSVLFIAINPHNMTSSANAATEAGRAADKAAFAKHLEFIDKVLEINEDNGDILWKVLYFHESPYGSSYHGDYTMDSSGAYTARDEQYSFINIREYFLPGIYDRDFDVVLSGHDHCYTRTHVLKHEAIDTNGMYYGNETITPFEDGSYTYADGTTTPTFKDFVDANGVTHSNVRTTSIPVKVTNPDGVVHITASSSSGSQCNNAAYFHPMAAVQVGHTAAIKRQAMRIDVTPTTMTFTNYGLGNSTADVDPSANILDTFTIEKTNAVKVKGVSLPETAEIPVGMTEELTAKLSPVEPDNANVIWASDNEAVATVDENGVVTAVSEGTANITVTTEDGGYTATCVVTVVAATAVTGVELDNATLSMLVDEVKTINATVSPDNATTKDVIWTSSDDTVATVTANGSIKAIKAGTATITVTTKDGAKTATCVVTVSAISATSVVLDTNYLTMLPLDTATLTATVYPANATYQNITWTSSDATVVKVDENGNIKALKQGTATITATNADGKVGKCSVTVNGGWLFSQDYEDGEYTVFMSSSNGWSRVKDDDGNWIMQLVIDENTTIAADYYPASLNASGTAPIPTDNFVVSFDVCNMSADGAALFSIHAYDDNSGGNYYLFDARDLEIGKWYNVKFYKNGTAYARKFGEAEYSTIDVKTAAHGISSGTNRFALWLDCDSRMFTKYPGFNTTSEEVRKTYVKFDNFRISSEVNATGIELDKEAAEINSNETISLNASFVPGNTTDINVVYSTSDANVATVDQYGNVTGKGNGTATITVTTLDGGYTDTCEVTVGGATLASSVTLSKSETTLNVGETETITATVSPDDASVKAVNWTSEDASVATVDANGCLTAVGPGTTNIVATAADGSGVSAKCAVTVNAIPVTTVTMDKETISMVVLEETTVSTTVLPENASFKTVTYTSSDTSVATVDENGLIKARGKGTAVITASVQDGVTDTCTVTVGGLVIMEQDFEDETNTLFYSKSVAGDKCWTRVQDEDGNWVLKLDADGITDNFIAGNWPTAQSAAFAVPHTEFTFSFDVCRTSDVGYRTLNLNFYTNEYGNHAVQVDTNSFETGVWYDVKVVYNGSYTTYYKKRSDNVYSILPYKAGTRPSSGHDYIHFSLAKDSYATTAEAIRQSEMLFDNFTMAVDDGLRLTKDGNVFKATAPAEIVGKKVYIAAYDASDRLIYAGLADFDNDGTEVTLSGIESAAYFKAFIWDENSKAVIEEAILNN